MAALAVHIAVFHSNINHNFLTCHASKQGHCPDWPWLGEFSAVVLSCSTLSRSTAFADVSLIQPEDSFNLLFKAIQYNNTLLILKKEIQLFAFDRQYKANK